MPALSEDFGRFLLTSLEIIAALVIVAIGALALWAIVAYIVDVTQTRQAIRRNYPVIGRFRYFFEHLGEFFRQYFFAMDREEMPFNRAQRSWVYRAAKDLDTTVAFGSTRDLRRTGTVLFVNCAFPTLGEDAVPPGPLTIGEGCPQPYTTASLFNISGMSYGAISRPAVQALSHGARKAGCWLNTGEGGLSPWHLEGGCDIVFQIGTAKNGVRDLEGNLSDDKLQQIAAIPQVRLFEIKLSQGAKPGKGGILPGSKVTEEIARIRGILPGQDAISPNPHPDINSFGDMLDMIDRVRAVTGKPVGIKTVIGSPDMLDGLFRTILERGNESAPDFITVDGAEGGTGAAPMPLIDAVGLPLAEALPLLVDKLHEYGLRERVRVIASGKLINPTDLAWALCVGADFIVSARGFMFALGCIQALQCNRNTCPTGITTHNEKLQRGLNPADKAERVANYVRNMVREVGIIAHSCGVRSPRELNRTHARLVLDNGLSVPLDTLHPLPTED
ncbi:FMN-binding glutamate synthase family protein [endosymbiont of unidentified scaly snail isolate Monju]|uniref:FMN-binding glutamate synthase family protein n=1 Tax=endosymbiont of unidentified scaly snail isolate Monju TaxID=1248727 RepID=UPI0003892B0C|nr:FMN-binding glutamate synthase family protein [endosymbiont of unidentified scaly snail isolate Monju]BAN68444.1 glutamate synthase (ferredoxin) [endosymbiont of unidentified scaly snail isolate Monju]